MARNPRKTGNHLPIIAKSPIKGMGLKFVAPVIVEGIPTARLEKETERMNEIWANVVIVICCRSESNLDCLKIICYDSVEFK